MIIIKETTMEDIKNLQRLWSDGDIMQFVGFPNGLHETDEAMQHKPFHTQWKKHSETVQVDPSPQNAKAIALYERLGFK